MIQSNRKVLDAIAVVLGLTVMVVVMSAATHLFGWVGIAIFTTLFLGALVLAVTGYVQFRKEEKAKKDA